jgi:hypothetical protein
MTPGRNTRPTQFTYPETKVRAFNAITCYHLPTWPQPGSTHSIHCFTAHPMMGGETCHYTHLTVHCLSPVTLEGGYNKACIPRSQGFGLIRPASTRPRPSLDAQRSSIGKEGRHGTVPRVISPSHPQRHHGVQGWPAIPGTRHYSHLYRDRQNITSRLPGALASSYPIKGQVRTLRRGRRDNRQDTSQKPSASNPRPPTQRSTSQAIVSVLFFSL